MRVWIGEADQHLVCVEFLGLLMIGDKHMAIVRMSGMQLSAVPIDRVHLTKPIPRGE